MRAGLASRRGSFFETWRLFATGWQPLALIGLIYFGLIVWMQFQSPRGARFETFALPTLAMLSGATWNLERQFADRLAFISLFPQPVPVKWLVLVPMCAIAIVNAGFVGVVGPALAAPVSLGCGLWVVGSVRWLHHVGRWALLAWLWVPLVPLAAYGAHRVGGWAAAAAVAMAFGVGALAFQPSAYVGRPSRRPGQDDAGPVVAPKRQSRRAVSAAHAGRWIWLVQAVRFFQLNTSRFGYGFLLFSSLLVAVPVLFLIPGKLDYLLVLMAFVLASVPVGEAYSGEMHEFLGVRPFGSWPRFVGGVLSILLILLVMPAIGCAVIDREWIDRGGLLPFVFGKVRPPDAAEIRYLREVVGASFLPDKWPAGGLPLDLWQRLRPLLYLDLLRVALLMVTVMFAGATALIVASVRRVMPKTSLLIVLFAFVPALLSELAERSHLPRPPLWATALLATAATVQFLSKARAVAGTRSEAAQS